MKLKGSTAVIERELNKKGGIRCKGRFNQVLAYFKRLEDMLKLFGIHSEDPEDDAQIIVGKKDAVRNASTSTSRTRNTNGVHRSYTKNLFIGNQAKLVFDFGLVLE